MFLNERDTLQCNIYNIFVDLINYFLFNYLKSEFIGIVNKCVCAYSCWIYLFSIKPSPSIRKHLKLHILIFLLTLLEPLDYPNCLVINGQVKLKKHFFIRSPLCLWQKYIIVKILNTIITIKLYPSNLIFFLTITRLFIYIYLHLNTPNTIFRQENGSGY